MTRDPLSIPGAHIIAVLAAKKRAGHWVNVEQMKRGRARQRLFWNAVAGMAATLVAIGLVALMLAVLE